jgi:hypothetical protein
METSYSRSLIPSWLAVNPSRSWNRCARRRALLSSAAVKPGSSLLSPLALNYHPGSAPGEARVLKQSELAVAVDALVGRAGLG